MSSTRMTVGELHGRLTELLAGDLTLADVAVAMEPGAGATYVTRVDVEEYGGDASGESLRELYLSGETE